MIVQETIIVNGRELLKTYSDDNKMILQVETGIEYSEAVDVIPCMYTYVETTTEIENKEITLNEQDND